MSTARLQAAGFTRRFRNAAKEFREFPDNGRITLVTQGKGADGRPCEIIEGVRTADKLKEVCGVWLIEAHKLGLVPAEQADLVRLIEEHANPYPKDEPLPPGAFMRRERCPYNLFLDICAGGIVVGRIVERNDRTELEPDGEAPQGRAWSNPGRFVTCVDGKPVEVFADRRKRYRETGGLMEAALPGAVQQKPMERCAEACEWLADLIEHAAAPPTATKQSEGGVLPADPFTALRQFARDKLKGKERAVIEALCDTGGEMPIADLASKDGVGWDDEFQGFKDVQRRLNPKIKAEKWEVRRQNNAAILKALKRR